MTISENLARIKEQISEAARQAGRQTDEITLIAVSKRKPVELISQAMAAGHHDFGENYFQEAQEKIDALADKALRWHFIGRLQSNKAKGVAGNFTLIHTVDRLKLARAIDKKAAERQGSQDILIQVNVGQELQKGGVLPDNCQQLLEQIASLSHLQVKGLMTMPPAVSQPEQARPYFAQLRQLAESLVDQGLLCKAPQLSMGMSNDFTAAIQEGATMVRVGTAIFGQRQ